MTGFPFGNLSGRWDDFLEIAGGDARYAAMLINRTAAGEPEEGLHPETLVDQDIRDGEAFMLAGRPIVPEDVYDLPRTVHGLYSELVDNVGRSGTLLRDWRGFSAGADADDVLREIEGAFGETEDSRAGTVLGAYAEDTFMSPIYAAEDAARDVTPLTPWEDEDGVAFLSRTLDADAGAVVPCLWYCRRDEGQGFEVGGVKLDCSKIAFDEVAAAAASNGLDWFEDAIGMDGDGVTAGLVADDLDSIKSLVARCPAWIECLPSYSAKAAKGVDDVVQAVKTYRTNAKRAFRESIPGRIPECLFEGARAAASKTAGGADIGTGPHI